MNEQDSPTPRVSSWLLPLLLLGGCTVVPAILGARLAQPPAEFDRFARYYVELVRSGAVDSAYHLLDPPLAQQTPVDAIREGSRFLAVHASGPLEIVGWSVVRFGETRAEVSYQTHGDSGFAIITLGILSGSKGKRVQGFRWQSLPAPLAQLNRFTLAGRSGRQLLFLVIAILAALSSISASLLAVLTGMSRRWAVIGLLGLGAIGVNWTDGSLLVHMLSIHVPSASIFRTGQVGPWFVSWSLPLGALAVFVKWRRDIRAEHLSPGPAAA